MYESEELIKSIIEELENVKRRLAELEAEILSKRGLLVNRMNNVQSTAEQK